MRPGLRRRLLAGAAALTAALSGSLVVLTAEPAGALTVFTVDSAADGAPTAANCTPVPVPGGCRLRDAFAAANTTADNVRIDVAPGLGTITIAAGADYTGGTGGAFSLTLEGNGVSIVLPISLNTISASAGASLTVDNVRATSGFTAISASIPLTVTNSTLTPTVTDPGTTSQGIVAGAGVVVTNTTITSSQGPGGNHEATGILSSGGAVNVTDSTISALPFPGKDARGIQTTTSTTVSVTRSKIDVVAVSPGSGSGILSFGTAPVTVDTTAIQVGGGFGFAVSTGAATMSFDRSTAAGAGQTALEMSAGGTPTASLTNSTVTGNPGTGIRANVVNLTYATITDNAAIAAQVNLNMQTLNTFGSVIARPGTGQANCAPHSTTNSTGYNYSDDANATTSCKLANATDRIGASNNPLLGALGPNGGPTPTRVPQAGSPLIDQIPAASPCGGVNVVVDQRGLPRPTTAGTFCDIGAVEVQPPTALLLAPDFTG